MAVNDTLAERGNRYGDFKAHAEITQGLKGVMQKTAGWDRLTASMKESLEMVMHKIGRILNGDPTYADSWHDIAGYATLIDDELTGSATSVTLGENRTVAAPERVAPAPTTADVLFVAPNGDVTPELPAQGAPAQ